MTRATRMRGTLLLAAMSLFAVPASLHAQAPAADGWIVTPDSIRLYYRVAGRGPDTLIAIHGGPGVDLESIAGDFVPLTKHHVVVFYDQRGTGRSALPMDTSRLGATQQLTDLDAVRKHFGLAHVTLVAHSYGPLLAASYAIAHPDVVARMVLFNPVPPRRAEFWDRFGRAMAARLTTRDTARMNDASRRLADSKADARRACRDYWAVALRPRLAEPNRVPPVVKSDLCASDPAGIRYGLTITNRLVFASYGDWDLRAALRHVPARTLVVHGEDDAIPMDLVAEWATALPHARLFKVPRAGHFSYAERPELVWPEVERFLGGAAVVVGR